MYKSGKFQNDVSVALKRIHGQARCLASCVFSQVGVNEVAVAGRLEAGVEAEMRNMQDRKTQLHTMLTDQRKCSSGGLELGDALPVLRAGFTHALHVLQSQSFLSRRCCLTASSVSEVFTVYPDIRDEELCF